MQRIVAELCKLKPRWHLCATAVISLALILGTTTLAYSWRDAISSSVPKAHAAYDIASSARFNSADSAALYRTNSAGDTRKFTWSAWVKRGKISGGALFAGAPSSGGQTSLVFVSSDKLRWREYDNEANQETFSIDTDPVYRDPSAWLHVVLVSDTSNATANDRVKIYVNGTQQGLTYTNPIESGETTYVNTTASTGRNLIGTESYSGSGTFDGYLSDVYFIDGQALDPTSFGEYDDNGYWRPKSYTGSYGTNGFHLNFSNGAALGTDSSSNGNNWTVNNMDATDQVIDTPTNSFATWSPIDQNSNITLSQGNLQATYAGATDVLGGFSGFGMHSGKWYWEFTAKGIAGTNYPHVGIERINQYDANFIPETYFDLKGGVSSSRGSAGPTFAAFATDDVGMLAFDADTGEIFLGKNGTWLNSGNPATGAGEFFSGLTDGPFRPGYSSFSSRYTIHNFGQGGQSGLTYDSASGGYFKYTPPSGFKALSTANLPAPAIAVPKSYFDAKTYTGNGSTQSVSGLSFQPDLVWLKDRTSANSHGLFDAVRTATKYLSSNSSAAETTDSNSLTALNTGGFSLGTTAAFNTSGNSYISWNWKEGATSGFDVVTYSGNGVAGRTVSHGLGAIPAFILLSDRGDVGAGGQDWKVYHQSLGATKWLALNSTAAVQTSNIAWYDTAPTNSVFTVSAHDDVNNASDTYVAYLFAEKEGFSKFGSYTGNGSTDGPFVYTGFKPRYIMFKRTSTAGADWSIRDTARDTYNPSTATLYADLANADSAASNIDILSNGFKVRGTGIDYNSSGDTFIYAAFAEQPFKYSAASAAASAVESAVAFLMGMTF